MIEKQNKRILFAKALTFALLALMLLEMLLPVFTLNVSAEGTTTTYSNVLDDLKKDETFNPEDYPAKADDYSLQVIQVAEGSNGELFVYVYNPSRETKGLRASKINMSLQDPMEENPSNDFFDLTWLNSNGTLEKYIVNNFKISDEVYRCYNIAAIYRPFDKNLGDESFVSSEDITGYKGFKVGYYWAFRWYNNSLQITSGSVEVVEATIHAVGFVKYYEGFELFSGRDWVDSHYIAFSVDNYKVDYIYEAEVEFSKVDYVAVGQNSSNLSYSYDESSVEPLEITLINGDKGTAGGALFSLEYQWDRISTVTDFCSDIEDHTNIFTADSKEENLKNAQFAFRFYETERVESSTTMGQSLYGEMGTYVYDVGLVRLKFLSGNKVYNLGVVSDIVSDDGLPDYEVGIKENIQNALEDGFGKIVKVLAIVALILLIICLGPYLEKCINVIWSAIKIVATIISKIITFPFKLIGHLFSKK